MTAMPKQSKKELLNPIRYKTFSLAPTSEFEVSKSIGGSKLVPVYTAKDKTDKEAYRFIGTSEAKDRDGEIVLMDGWDFKNYNNNPIVLWGHNNKDLPLGKVVGILKDEVNKAIYFDVQFSESYDFAKTVENLVKEGILKAVSLGFRVTDWEWSEKLDALLLTKSELFELSIVNVPANQEALITDSDKSLDEEVSTKSLDIESLANVIREMQGTIQELQAAMNPSSKGEPNQEIGDVGVTENGEELPEGTEPVTEDEPILKTPDISAESIELIVQAVVARLQQAAEPAVVETPEPTEASEDDSKDEVVEETNEVEDEEEVVEEEVEEEDKPISVSVEELNETDGFIIVNEEEN